MKVGKSRRRSPRREKRRRRRSGMRLPLAVLAGFAPGAVGVWNRRTSGTAVSQYVIGGFTGYVPGVGWSAAYAKEVALPILAGLGAHKIAGMLGVNRALGRMGVPLIRI